MEIHLHVDQDLDGRLSGTASTADGTYRLAFSGSMELLANVEAICRMGELAAREEGAAEGAGEPA